MWLIFGIVVIAILYAAHKFRRTNKKISNAVQSIKENEIAEKWHAEYGKAQDRRLRK